MIIGRSLDRKWLYRDRETIRETVNERATRCQRTGRPLVYLSSDAHALRRYMDESYSAEWKMINGLRAWCFDRDTGAILHLGGEYTWGDCRAVADILRATIKDGYLPEDGDFGGGKRALYVWVSDGMPWFDDHLLPLFEPEALVVVLDAYHVLERLKGFATGILRQSKSKAKALYENLKPWVTGILNPATGARDYPDHSGALDYADAMLAKIQDIPTKQQRRADTHKKLVAYLTATAHRIDYKEYRACGFSIGSGPMESFHRTASQVRLKRPGARWTTENSQSILNLRLMKCVDRWDEFWTQQDITQRIRQAFAA